jgi:cytoskeletal protein CcmA (bactofilin family)
MSHNSGATAAQDLSRQQPAQQQNTVNPFADNPLKANNAPPPEVPGFNSADRGFPGMDNSGFTSRRASQQTPSMPVSVPISPRFAGNHNVSGDNELTIISRNTFIDGNVRSFADMSIDGDVKGDVETTKNIDLNGKIIGSITCNNAMMHTSQIQGNVRMKGRVDMKRDTLLIGDLMSTYADINGKVKGNLDIVGKADFKGDAVVFGDISASTITVEDGAIIQGYVSTTFLNKEESKNLFPDNVIIGDDGSVSRM